MVSKKAMFNVLLAAIVVVVIGLLLLVIGYQMEKKSKSIKDSEKCLLSVFANDQLSKINKAKKIGEFKVSYECPRESLRIELDDVEKYNRIDDTLMKTKLAEGMRSCWSKTGAGKLDPFKSSGAVDQTFCMVCSDVIFDSSLVAKAKKESPEYKVKGLQYWVAANKLHGMKTSLYEYFTGKRPSTSDISSLKASENSEQSKLNLDKKYVIIWRTEKLEVDWWAKAGLVVGVIIPVVGIFTLPTQINTVGAMIHSDYAGSGAGTSDFGAGLCLGTYKEEESSSKLAQEVCLVPEDTLSTKFDFEGKGKQTKEFCTLMIN